MAEAKYSVILDGRIQDGQGQVQVAANLARLFRTDESQIKPLLAGRPMPIKKGLPLNEAQKYRVIRRRSRLTAHGPGRLRTFCPRPVARVARCATPLGAPRAPRAGPNTGGDYR